MENPNSMDVKGWKYGLDDAGRELRHSSHVQWNAEPPSNANVWIGNPKRHGKDKKTIEKPIPKTSSTNQQLKNSRVAR